LGLAGVDRPDYYDSCTLPELGLPDAPRERVFGFVGGAMMNTDGHWKWVKNSSTGKSHLFNLDEDPHEQNDRQHESDETRGIAARLDGELTRQLLVSIAAAGSDRSIGNTPLWDDADFGQGRWHFDYPAALGS